MQISANVIRFPLHQLMSERRVAAPAQPAEVVAFPTETGDAALAPAAWDLGHIFAAHHIAARVADGIDAIAVL